MKLTFNLKTSRFLIEASNGKDITLLRRLETSLKVQRVLYHSTSKNHYPNSLKLEIPTISLNFVESLGL